MFNTDNAQPNIKTKGSLSEKEIPDVRDGLTPLAKVHKATNDGK